MTGKLWNVYKVYADAVKNYITDPAQDPKASALMGIGSLEEIMETEDGRDMLASMIRGKGTPKGGKRDRYSWPKGGKGDQYNWQNNWYKGQWGKEGAKGDGKD